MMYRSLLIVFLFLLAVPVVLAQSPARVEIFAPSGACNGTYFEGSYTVTVSDKAGNALSGSFNLTRVYTVNGQSYSFSGDVVSGSTVPFSISAAPDAVTSAELVVWLTADPSIKTSVHVLDCATGQWTAVFAGDGRLNYGRGDLHAALYVGRDDSGALALDVYAIQPDSSGVWIGEFDSEAFSLKSPETNTLIGTVGIVDLYALKSGEYQANIKAGGKTYAVIFTWPPAPDRVYGYTIGE